MTELSTKYPGEMSIEECRDYLARVFGWLKIKNGGWFRPSASAFLTVVGQKSVTIPARESALELEHPIGDTVAAALKLLPRNWRESIDYTDEQTVFVDCYGTCFGEPLIVSAEARTAELAVFRAVVNVWESLFEDGLSNSEAWTNQRIKEYIQKAGN